MRFNGLSIAAQLVTVGMEFSTRWHGSRACELPCDLYTVILSLYDLCL